MIYNDVRDEITTGSLVGHVDEHGEGWVAVAVRGEDLFNCYGRVIEARPEMAGRVLVVFAPPAGVAANQWRRTRRRINGSPSISSRKRIRSSTP